MSYYVYSMHKNGIFMEFLYEGLLVLSFHFL